MSQNSAEVPAHRELLDALRLFMSDLQGAALEALEFLGGVASASAGAQEVDAARLQGLGDNLIKVQSWVLKEPDPFAGPKVNDVQLLARLNVLHLQAEDVIKQPQRLALRKYFERSADIINLLDQPSVNNIEFLLKTLRFALEDSPPMLPETGPEPSVISTVRTQPKPTGIDIFIAAGEASLSAARALATKLAGQKVMSNEIKVHQAWSRIPRLSTLHLSGMTTEIRACQYGALLLAAEETTVDNNDADSDQPVNRHLRLPPDVEFLLGLMAGGLGMEKTYLVVPSTEKDKPELATFLNGLTFATYNPNNLHEAEAMNIEMDIVSTRIIQAIAESIDKEKRQTRRAD